jgi:hypothetical protein
MRRCADHRTRESATHRPVAHRVTDALITEQLSTRHILGRVIASEAVKGALMFCTVVKDIDEPTRVKLSGDC